MPQPSPPERPQNRPAAGVLALNSGSSSLKFSLYGEPDAPPLLEGEAESIGTQAATFRAHDGEGREIVSETKPLADQQAAIARIGQLVADRGGPPPAAVGHRIVHGGPHLRQHCLIDEAVLAALQDAIPFAPLHIPASLAVIRFAREHFPGAAEVACFDTSFHASLPQRARLLPLPRALQAEGIERYGFHGLSCASIVQALAGELPPRLVIAHLGNGASVTAVANGVSVDTSMGLTPTGGVIMGTRSGDLDPGVLIYLMRARGLDADSLEDMVDRHGGLLAISGVASDVRRLHEAAAANADASLALDMFCDSVRKQIVAMMAVLGGADMLVFTGGIGQHDSLVREAICATLAWAGVRLDASRNRASEPRIEASGSACAVRVMATQENAQIARETWALADPARA
jgi:acetate kinase